MNIRRVVFFVSRRTGAQAVAEACADLLSRAGISLCAPKKYSEPLTLPSAVELLDDEAGKMRAHITEIPGAAGFHQKRCHGHTAFLVETFRDDHDARALLVDELLAALQELVLVEIALRQIDQVGASGAGLIGKGACCRDPAGISAHGLHDHDVDRQAAYIAADLRDARCHIEGGACIAGRMVGDSDIVVHGLGDAHDIDIHAFGPACPPYLAAGVHRAISAGRQKPADMLPFEGMGKRAVVLLLKGLSRCADGRGGGVRQKRERLSGNRAEVDEASIQNAADAAERTEHAACFRCPERLVDRPEQRGIDDGSRASSMHDKQRILGAHARCLPSRSARPSRRAMPSLPSAPFRSC